jgi:hypothetical protein
MDFDWWRRYGLDWLNTGRDYLWMFFLAEVLMCLRGIPNKWSQHRPEFRFGVFFRYEQGTLARFKR